MKLTTERYSEQMASWPSEGRHIMVQYDDDSVVVYQAYRPIIDIEDISDFVVEQHQYVSAKEYDKLMMPTERPYPVVAEAVRERLQIV